ncbi:peptidase M56 [Flavobacterium sp. CYK-4]|uniref:M56 family metallopeptidase n=1 Tax=Flavobacterium lotistagni TaxID=2709660 RepID=UPI00140C6A78|nr:M56 family metallopeptidase [Flavobacterium lotistagni]NHM07404.1 peptidase M56 [Flavobacterium lotistagni]
MENLFLYLLKASGLLVMFFMAYHFLLRRETFFSANRWFLLAGLVTSVVLPLITFKKIIWVEAQPEMYTYSGNIPMQTIAEPQGFEINWYWVFAGVYALGMLVLLLRFLFDFKNLRSVLKGKTITQQADFKLIDVDEKVAPFSYFNYIVYNSDLFDQAELAHILAHEKVHCEQRHSIDVLIARIFCIAFWYNPFIWLYKKAMLQNLEFIADNEALKQIEDKKSYQITLLKATTHQNCVAITNPFYQSLIKKRIVMLNKNQSKKWNSWKYALIVPVLAAFLLYFQVNVIAQEKQGAPFNFNRDGLSVTIDKNTTDQELKAASEKAKSEGVTLKFSKVKRNSAGEITGIKAVYKDKAGNSGTSQTSGDEPIKPMRFFKDDNGQIGFGNAKQIRIIKKGNHTSDDEGEDIEIHTIVAEAPEAPEPPEAVEPTEAPEAPEAPELPSDKHIIIKKIKDKNGKISITVNGETMDLDVDKIVNDALADTNFSFNFSSDDTDEEIAEEMKKAKIHIEKIRPQMERAKRDMERRKPEMEEARRQMEEARRDMEDARQEMENARKEMEQARKDLEMQKAQLKQSKKK